MIHSHSFCQKSVPANQLHYLHLVFLTKLKTGQHRVLIKKHLAATRNLFFHQVQKQPDQMPTVPHPNYTLLPMKYNPKELL